MVNLAARHDPTKALRLASDQLDRGELVMAERTIARLLLLRPECADAFNLLSVIANTAGRYGDALANAETAIRIDPARPEFHFSRGRALKSARRLDEALQAYQQALRLRPAYAEVLVSQGVVLRLLGRLDDAIASYRQALLAKPEFPVALSNLGNALAERIGRSVGEKVTAEDLREAEHAQRRALALAPGNANLLHNLGLLLKLTGRYEEAIELLNRALAIDSSRADTCLLFGDALAQESRFDLAKQLYERWLVDHPARADILLQLAISMHELGDSDGALACLERVRQLAGELPEALHLLGRIVQQRPPDNVDAVQTLAIFRAAIDARPDYAEAVCSYLLTLCYVEDDPERLLGEHRTRVARIGPVHTALDWPAPRVAGRRLRLGYLSHDFKRHSVAYFLEGILEAHDRSRFEIVCFKTNAGGDPVTERLQSLGDTWIECGHLSNPQLAERVRAEDIDILIDLCGLTSGARIGALNLRAAPCQITYLGYPASTGAECFDFRVSDGVIDPVGEVSFNSEALLRCPQTMFCYRPGPAPEVGALPAIERGHVTFGSFNNFAKVGEGTLALWCDVLRAVPGSKLRVKAAAMLQHSSRQWIRHRFARHGIDEDRIVLQPWLSDLQSHLGAYHDVDIGLDTSPFNGATTTCEALYMGVPVVTLAGRTQPSRMGASILGAVGLSELVAGDASGYVEAAQALARDLERLAALRASMRSRLQASRLFDKAGFTRDFEGLLEHAWLQKRPHRTYERIA